MLNLKILYDFLKSLCEKNKLQTERICNGCYILLGDTKGHKEPHTAQGANKYGEPGTRGRPGQCCPPGQRPQGAPCCPRPSNHSPGAFPLEALPSPHSDLPMTCRPEAPVPPSLPSLQPTATSTPSRPHCPCACKSTSGLGFQGGVAHKAATCTAPRPPGQSVCASPAPL